LGSAVYGKIEDLKIREDTFSHGFNGGVEDAMNAWNAEYGDNHQSLDAVTTRPSATRKYKIE